MKLILSTDNPHKLIEIKNILKELPLEVLTKSDIGCGEIKVEENRDTLEGNALLKAQAISQKTDGFVLADDTGLFIPALEGEPGVHSARYAGEHDDEKNRQKVLKKLKTKEDRSCYFKTVLVLIDPLKEIKTIEGICKGQITHSKRGDESFGYDCIFQPEGYGETFGQMDLEEKNKISHRAKALIQLRDYFEKIL
ncbi:MAG: RdgB/HAM1 family non-canonical purine NTP pyrophosphatase [Tissierellia bacterium]|nr:RdgB/HAM1 family non-canonical purine NTP pyrophosphatase [Tissierellia bacterium]